VGDAQGARIAGFVVVDQALRLALWRASDGALERTFPLPPMAERVVGPVCRDVDWTGAERLTLVDSERVLVLDTSDGSVLGRYAVPSSDGCALADAGRRVVLMHDGAIEVVELASGRTRVFELGDGVASLTPSRRALLIVNRAGYARLDVISGEGPL